MDGTFMLCHSLNKSEPMCFGSNIKHMKYAIQSGKNEMSACLWNKNGLIDKWILGVACTDW